MDAERSALLARLESSGYALVQPQVARVALQLDLEALESLRESWERLPRDQYLRDGGRYRARRHSCFVQTPGVVQTPGAGLLPAPQGLLPVPHRAHWQPTSYNALHGGMHRWFEPLEPAVSGSAAWGQLVSSLGELFAALQPVSRWYIEAHQFRIDTSGGIGRPTPEGAHRDGVDFVAVVLVGRRAVLGGETRVFDAHGAVGVRFTMEQPWSMLLMNDARVIHETTPIQPRDTPDERGPLGVRDTLVLTYRAGGFQEPEGEGAGG
jgi:hypothetical protein